MSSSSVAKLCGSIFILVLLGLIPNAVTKPLLFSPKTSSNTSRTFRLKFPHISSELNNENYLKYFAKMREEFSQARPDVDNNLMQYISKDVVGSEMLAFLNKFPVISGLLTSAGCDVCRVIIATVQTLFSERKTEEEITTVMTNLCISLRLEDRRVCSAIVPEFQVFSFFSFSLY